MDCFWERFDRDGECWIWRGVKYPEVEYGAIGLFGRRMLAHRWVYEMLVRPIPVGMELDHICGVPGCVNPEHLSEVTRLEHAIREARRRRIRNGLAPSPVDVDYALPRDHPKVSA